MPCPFFRFFYLSSTLLYFLPSLYPSLIFASIILISLNSSTSFLSPLSPMFALLFSCPSLPTFFSPAPSFFSPVPLSFLPVAFSPVLLFHLSPLHRFPSFLPSFLFPRPSVLLSLFLCSIPLSLCSFHLFPYSPFFFPALPFSPSHLVHQYFPVFTYTFSSFILLSLYPSSILFYIQYVPHSPCFPFVSLSSSLAFSHSPCPLPPTPILPLAVHPPPPPRPSAGGQRPAAGGGE